EEDRALEALREARNEGSGASVRTLLKMNPVFDLVRGEPGFQAIIDELEAELASQLVSAREMKASGELAPVSD
ncbi:MAG: hypothetical protein ACR2QU_09235, partial [Gammaproteobacteria bacterium]